MERLTIKTHPDSALRKKSTAVANVGQDEVTLMDEMALAMYKAHGVGLAAPQIGISKKILVLDAGNGLLKIVNPEIMSKKGAAEMEEGCLSVPEKSVNVTRAEEIAISYVDENSKKHSSVFRGLAARIIQHEIDHLDGRLIIDYLPWHKKIFLKRGRSRCQL